MLIRKEILPSYKQVWIFVLVWFSYACSYLLGKPISLIKPNVKKSMNLSEDMLGYMELSLSLPYAFGSIFLGFLGDKLGSHIVLGGGLLCSAMVTSVMGLWNNFWYVIILLFLSGLFQSLMSPAANIIIARTFSKKSLTAVFGFYSVCIVFGSVLSTFITVNITKLYSWHYVFYIPSGLSLIFAILGIFLLKEKNLPKLNTKEEELNEPEKVTSLKFWEVLKVPKISLVSFSLFFLRGIRNAVFFWLPYYLSTVLGYNDVDAGFVALMYDVGSFVGPLVLNVLFNHFMDDLVASILCTVLIGLFTLILLFVVKDSYLLFISLFCSGAFTASADIILGASYITKISSHHRAKSSILCVVNGIGSIGNIVEGPLVAYLSYWFGMQALVPCIVVFCALGAVPMIRLLYIQTKERKKEQSREENVPVLLMSVIRL